MKKLNFLFGVLFLCMGAFAQHYEPVNTKKDQRQFEGYTIRLVPALNKTYGYEVLQGNRRVIYQTQNPFTTAPRGMTKKEDAFAVAQFQIKQLQAKAGRNQKVVLSATNKTLPAGLSQNPFVSTKDETLYNQHLSPKVAQQLKISITQ